MQDTELDINHISIIWLGQAGFIITDHAGTMVVIDPYLTDCCERIYGYKRFTAKLIAPEQLKPDILFLSHQHEDHLDVDAVPIMAASPDLRILGSPTVVQTCLAMGIDKSKLTSLEEGDETEHYNFLFKARFADHGESVPDAIGVTIDVNGIRIYYASDTAYRPDKLREIADYEPHIAILPINGAFGNLNGIEAARAASDIGAKVVIPCHFWTFKEHCSPQGTPQSFFEALSCYAPQCKPIFLAQGEQYIY